ncbi:MAG: lytic transglycosylase [Proteobacteria bacterium ST_bin11]|nr:MAG: lytic transglycosylase [Proteobacteria bacterium ST_bin11]
MKAFARLLLLVAAIIVVSSVHAAEFDEAPRVQAALEQGLAAEKGKGVGRNLWLAIRLYCDAATMGSPEGFMRIGRVLATGHGLARKPEVANAYLALAASLGNEDALKYYDSRHGNAELQGDCDALAGAEDAESEVSAFNMDAYLSKQSFDKQKIVRLIHHWAPKYQVDARFVLAIALAESNMNPTAVSPKNAQGVMQLIPATQERFGVLRPFDPEQNIKGGMAYIRWLERRFAGDWRLVAAAYNAGEGVVDRHAGIPPYAETQQYVRRVMHFAGMATEKSLRFN